MAIGCGPDVTGNLTAGSICTDCGEQGAPCDPMVDEQYGRDDPASPIGRQPKETGLDVISPVRPSR